MKLPTLGDAMRPTARLLCVLLLGLLAARAGADGVGTAVGDPTHFLGMDLGAAVTALGLPRDMFTWRGTDQGRDNVVFYYADALYLFWFRDRVWQVRFDRRYTGPVFGLTIGMSRDQIIQSYPRKLLVSGDSLYFDLDPDGFPSDPPLATNSARGFPVRVRLVFDAGVLSDMYVYRSDF
jgi:hypothetical protein